MNNIQLDFSGKVALVSGGSQGLGQAVALNLAQLGAGVAICGRKKENLDQAQALFKNHGHEILATQANVAKADQVKSLFEAVDQKFGRLDVLINNVATNIYTPSLADAEEGLWDKIMETNLKSAFLTSSGAVKLMRKTGKGKIVNISSTAAKKAAAKGMGIYSVSKAGLEMLTRVMAVELAPEHINVNAVAPSMIKTKFSQPLWSNEPLIKDYLKTIPMGRIAETGDIVGAVLFLCSNLADFITGEVITVDGGSMA
jgi:NAD(P)-dependent dehydrogenase (short-subunit alcohol dehydrogenase family)